MKHWLHLWWRQEDQFEQVSEHLRLRNVDRFARRVVTTICILLSVISAATILSETGPRTTVQIACAAAASAGAAGGAVLWSLRWPTIVQARWFTIGSSSCIALAALAQGDALAAIVGCTAFATMAGYIAIIHSAPLMAYNLALATLTASFEGVRTAGEHGIVTALLALAMIFTLIVAVPIGIQVTTHVLGADAVLAQYDQLTGLLNRGAFHRQLKAYVERNRDRRAWFVLAVIDLDRFKQLNDRYGHGVGDEALVAVAAALRNDGEAKALVGRLGGEEFAIAGSWGHDETEHRAARLCKAIETLPVELTASVGTAAIETEGFAGDAEAFVAALIDCADSAMYVAKRRGGNQAHHVVTRAQC